MQLHNKKEVGTSNLSRNLDEKTYNEDTEVDSFEQQQIETHMFWIKYGVKAIMDLYPGHSGALDIIKQATEQGIMWHVDELNKNKEVK